MPTGCPGGSDWRYSVGYSHCRTLAIAEDEHARKPESAAIRLGLVPATLRFLPQPFSDQEGSTENRRPNAVKVSSGGQVLPSQVEQFQSTAKNLRLVVPGTLIASVVLVAHMRKSEIRQHLVGVFMKVDDIESALPKRLCRARRRIR